MITSPGIILLSLLTIAMPDQPAPAASATRPNVIVILTDDQGTVDLHIAGATDLHTPNLDALARRGVRLVILDEPFRGLDREQRRVLLQRARQEWRAATLLCITHDVRSTQAFDRVLVVEGGRIIEDDAPARLASRPETRYRALLDAEAAVHAGLWSSARWRRLHLVAGRVHEGARPGSTTGAGGG